MTTAITITFVSVTPAVTVFGLSQVDAWRFRVQGLGLVQYGTLFILMILGGEGASRYNSLVVSLKKKA